VLGDAFEMGGGLAPAARLKTVLAKRDPQHQLSRHGPVGLDQLAIAFLQTTELLVNLA
jgi:hypothetical protein